MVRALPVVERGLFVDSGTAALAVIRIVLEILLRPSLAQRQIAQVGF